VAAAGLIVGLVCTFAGSAAATTTWYVSLAGADSPTCGTLSSPCKTITYTIDQRAAPGDTLQIGAGTYAEHLTIRFDLTLQGAGMGQTIVDGSNTDRVMCITASAAVRLANMTIQHGFTHTIGGGIRNAGQLTCSRRRSPAIRPFWLMVRLEWVGESTTPAPSL
jgi:hypothetical protein